MQLFPWEGSNSSHTESLMAKTLGNTCFSFWKNCFPGKHLLFGRPLLHSLLGGLSPSGPIAFPPVTTFLLSFLVYPPNHVPPAHGSEGHPSTPSLTHWQGLPHPLRPTPASLIAFTSLSEEGEAWRRTSLGLSPLRLEVVSAT